MDDKNNSSAPIPACKACDGEGVIHTGIEEAPTTLCRACNGSGNTPGDQPPSDRVQGGLTEAQLDLLLSMLAQGGVTVEAAKRAILSRQSMMVGEAEMVMNAITEGQKRRASESREPAGNMTAEFPPHAAVLQDPGEIDERAAFEKFMSKRGWAAVYAGDGQYESPSVQDQWEAWQARAAVAAPQEQAELEAVPEQLTAGIPKQVEDLGEKILSALSASGSLVGMTFFHIPRDKVGPHMEAIRDGLGAAYEVWKTIAAAPTTPANAAAANGDGRKPDAWLVPSILSFEDRRTSCPVELVGQLEGTVAWEAALFSDGDIDAVTDKHGVEHKPIPLYRVAAGADGQKGDAK